MSIEETIKQIIASNLKNLKESRSISFDKFAESCNVPAGTFRNYFYGINLMPMETAIKICDAANIPIGRLFDGLIDFDNEQTIIDHIVDIFNGLCSKDKINAINMLTPYIESDIYGLPKLYKAKCGTKLRALREDSEILAADMAAFCGVEIVTLNGYETCQSLPSIPIFLDLCHKLNVSPEYILCNHISTELNVDRRFYALTPRKLKALSKTMDVISKLFSCI